MILSTQVVANKNDSEDSSSEDDIKNEGLNELKNIIKTNEENKQSKLSEIGKKPKNKISITGEDSSYNLSKFFSQKSLKRRRLYTKRYFASS